MQPPWRMFSLYTHLLLFSISHTRTEVFKKASIWPCAFSPVILLGGGFPLLLTWQSPAELWDWKVVNPPLPCFRTGFLPQFLVWIIYLLHVIFSMQSPSSRPLALNHWFWTHCSLLVKTSDPLRSKSSNRTLPPVKENVSGAGVLPWTTRNQASVQAGDSYSSVSLSLVIVTFWLGRLFSRPDWEATVPF